MIDASNTRGKNVKTVDIQDIRFEQYLTFPEEICVRTDSLLHLLPTTSSITFLLPCCCCTWRSPILPAHSPVNHGIQHPHIATLLHVVALSSCWVGQQAEYFRAEVPKKKYLSLSVLSAVPSKEQYTPILLYKSTRCTPSMTLIKGLCHLNTMTRC